MRQAIHILRKDVRHLWPQTSVMFALMIAHAAFAPRALPLSMEETMRANMLESLFSTLLPLGMWLLIALLVFEEALPGARHFWLTRPYRWRSLLAAKVLFVLIFVNAPLFVSDCYILWAQGFAVAGVLPKLLLRQLIVTALFVLPSFAIATVTRDVSGFALAWLILLLGLVSAAMIVSSLYKSNGFVLFDLFMPGFFATLLVTTCGVSVWQYAKRRTGAARAVLFAVTCAFLPVMSGIHWLTSLHAAAPACEPSRDQSSVRIEYDLERGIPKYTSAPMSAQGLRPGVGRLVIPLRVTGLPPGTLLRGTSEIRIDAGGESWPQRGGQLGGSVERFGGDYAEILDLETVRLNMLKQRQASLRGCFHFEIVRDRVEATAALTSHSFFVPDVGLCHVFVNASQTDLTCRAGLEPSVASTVAWDPPHGPRPSAYTFGESSLPWGLSPTDDLGTADFVDTPPGSKLAFIPRHKVAEFQRTLELRDAQLAKFIVPR